MHIRRAIPTDREVLLDVWLRLVRVTHAFVSEEDIQFMISQVRDYLASSETEFWVLVGDGPLDGTHAHAKHRESMPPACDSTAAVDESLPRAGAIMGFMGMSGSRMESLFLVPECHRRGGGRRLVRHAQALHGELTVDVNEQNAAACRFYEACGRAGSAPLRMPLRTPGSQ